MDTPTAVPMNRKLRYYYNHKDDPNFQARMAESKKKYYQANRQAIITKSLNRYYMLKATAEATAGTAGWATGATAEITPAHP